MTAAAIVWRQSVSATATPPLQCSQKEKTFRICHRRRFHTSVLTFCVCQNDDEDDEEEDGDDAEELLGKGARGAALLADRTRVSVHVHGFQFKTRRCVWVRCFSSKIWK